MKRSQVHQIMGVLVQAKRTDLAQVVADAMVTGSHNKGWKRKLPGGKYEYRSWKIKKRPSGPGWERIKEPKDTPREVKHPWRGPGREFKNKKQYKREMKMHR